MHLRQFLKLPLAPFVNFHQIFFSFHNKYVFDKQEIVKATDKTERKLNTTFVKKPNGKNKKNGRAIITYASDMIIN